MLWSDVNGTSVETISSNLDVMTDCYVDAGVFNFEQLNDAPELVDLQIFDAQNGGKWLKSAPSFGWNSPELDVTELKTVPAEFVLAVKLRQLLMKTMLR